MKFLIVLCMCAGLSVAQQGLPNYFQGSFNVPNAPIPAPGASAYGGAAPSPASWGGQPQAAAYSAAPRPQWAAPAAPAQYSPAAPAYGRALQAAPAAAPVASVPSQYGWNVQHSAPAPAPVAAAPAAAQWAPPAAAAPQPQYQSGQYTPAQYAQATPAAAPAAPQWSQAPQAQSYPAQAAPVAANPISAALLRPASVHYANIGESLNGDYKFGYKTGNGDSYREESRAPDGTVQGQYGYTDADGKQRIVKYSAGVNGFQVLNDGGASSPAPAAAAPASPQWGAPAAPQQQWGQPAAAPQQQWG